MSANASFYKWVQEKNDYDMNGGKTESVQCDKDLGVMIASNLKFIQHCKDASGKANRMLDFINKNIFFRNKNITLPLYIGLVRTYLKCRAILVAPEN